MQSVSSFSLSIGKGEWFVFVVFVFSCIKRRVSGQKYLDVCQNSFVWLMDVRGAVTASWLKEVLLRMKGPNILGWDCWRLVQPSKKTFRLLNSTGTGFDRLGSVAKSQQSPRLFYAVKRSRMDAVQLLLTEGTNPEATLQWQFFLCLFFSFPWFIFVPCFFLLLVVLFNTLDENMFVFFALYVGFIILFVTCLFLCLVLLRSVFWINRTGACSKSVPASIGMLLHAVAFCVQSPWQFSTPNFSLELWTASKPSRSGCESWAEHLHDYSARRVSECLRTGRSLLWIYQEWICWSSCNCVFGWRPFRDYLFFII